MDPLVGESRRSENLANFHEPARSLPRFFFEFARGANFRRVTVEFSGRHFVDHAARCMPKLANDQNFTFVQKRHDRRSAGVTNDVERGFVAVAEPHFLLIDVDAATAIDEFALHS